MRLSVQILAKKMEHLREIFNAGVNSVLSSTLLNKNVKINGNALHVLNKSFILKKPCHVVGFGKAVFGMASELLKIMGDQIQSGIITIPHGSLESNRQALSQELGAAFDLKFQVYQGAHDNEADERAMQGAIAIEELCKNLKQDDTLIVLITGGGSALLPLPKEGISLAEKQNLSRMLFHDGTNIYEVNCVRSRLSRLKGGGLARTAYPAQVISLILSDVVGDPLDVIASGPTSINLDAPLNPYEIVSRHNLLGSLPQNILNVLNQPPLTKSEIEKTRGILKNVHNFIIGSITLACEGARKRAEELGFFANTISTTMTQSVQEIAEIYFHITHYLIDVYASQQTMTRFQDGVDARMLRQLERIRVSAGAAPMCLIFGGEPTIVVENESGKGGRNTHLALEVAVKLNQVKGVQFLSCGTDGLDAATGVAGAISPLHLTLEQVELAGTHLKNSDSYTFLKNVTPDYLIFTGHTGTNVMDIHILLIQRKQ